MRRWLLRGAKDGGGSVGLLASGVERLTVWLIMVGEWGVVEEEMAQR